MSWITFFGGSRSIKRYVWYSMIGLVAFITLMCGKDCTFNTWLMILLSLCFMGSLLFVSIFFQDMEGKQLIRSWFFLRKIKKKIDPIAVALGAKISTRIHGQQSDLLRTYKFPDGNFIVLTVRVDHFNVWTPNWNTGHEKSTEGLGLLMKLINDVRSSL